MGGGGAERVILNLAAGFHERGLSVDLVLAKAEGPYLDEVPRGVRIVDLDAHRVLASLPGLVRYLRRETPVAMLATMMYANIVTLLARRLSGVQTRLLIREACAISTNYTGSAGVTGYLLPPLARFVYPWADGIVAVSHGVAKDLAHSIGLDLDRIRVIYNPVVDAQLFEKAKRAVDHAWFAPGEPPVILGVGRLTEQKDFSTLIRAFALVRKEMPARLVILGEGEKRAELETLIRNLQLAGDIAMPGFVKNPYCYMARAAVFVLASRQEGLPNALIQAMAVGTPLVATNCPSGPREILQNGRFGTLVPVGDEQAIARGVLKSIADPTRHKNTGNAWAPFETDKVTTAYMNALLGEGIA